MQKNTFNIPTALRILIILQLCVGLSALIWLIGYPFMGAHFKIQSEKLIIESVIGKQDTLFRLDPERAKSQIFQAKDNQTRFDLLEPSKREKIESQLSERIEELALPFLTKLGRAAVLIIHIPLLQVLWICLSVALPILVLLRFSSARIWIWLLPLVTLGYASNNQMRGLDPLSVSDRGLFPSDSYLIASQNASKEVFKEAWENYLIKTWSKEESGVREKQMQDGEFRFNLARLERFAPLASSFWEKQSPLLLLLYVVWNFYFAWQVTSKTQKNQNSG